MMIHWSDRVIRWGFYLLFALVPLLLTPWNYELFEFNKMMAVYALTVVITGAWLVKSIAQKEFRIAKTPLDIPIFLFVSSQLLSSLFSIDPHVSWFGYYSRFNGGMLSIVSYVLLYYAFVSNLANLPNLTNLLKGALASANVIAIYGVAERLGIDKHLWVQDVQNRVFSTLGQPNWLAAYLVALLPLAMAFGLKEFTVHREKYTVHRLVRAGFYCVLCTVYFLTLLFTRSRSGLLGFAVADAVFWGFVFMRFIRHRLASQDDVLRAWRGFAVLHVSFVIIFLLFGPSLPIPSLSRSSVTQATPSASYSAPLLEVGGTESGTIRKYVWQGAVSAWQSSVKTFLIGTGTETFAFAFYQHRPKGHNLTSEWDFLYNKAHNEYLNYLATTGVLGLGSHLLFIGAFIIWFFKFSEKEMFHAALFAGWISILVTNFFGFSVVIIQVFLFLFPAMMIEHTKEWKVTIHRGFFMLPVLFLSLVLLGLLAVAWYADTLYAIGYRANRVGQYDVAVDRLSRALALNPGEPLYADELGSAYAGFVNAAIEEKNATKAADLVKRSLAANDRALATSQKNVNFWKTRTKIYYAFSDFDPAFNETAIEALEQARKFSPNDPKITYNLAILYGRKGENDKAINTLKETIDLKPNYRDAYYALWVFYTEVKKPDLARNVLEDYLAKVDPGDKDFLERRNQ